MRGQAMILKTAIAGAQNNVRSFDAERKEAARRAEKAEAAVKTAARQKLMTIIVSALLYAGTIGGGYVYVKASLDPPAEPF